MAPHSLSVMFFFALFSAVSAAKWTIGQEVQTTSGLVTGHSASLFNGVSEYLGIPFAAPPTGSLRFMPPQDFPKSNATLVASKYGPDCPSSGASKTSNSSAVASLGGSLGQTFSQAGHIYSEDCLTLNVWTKPQVGEKKKAVLVWIYGGGFTTGSSNSPSYNGQAFAEKQDVIVVSINYRLNIFGFPSAPGIPSQNLGLLDHRKGLEWVKANIAAFGGDPDRITLFGESAGSRAVDIYSFAWASAKDPIVAGFISESGAAPLKTGAKLRPELWYQLSSRLGCGGTEKGNATVECVKGKSMQEIIEAASVKPAILGQFTPVVDGKVYFDDYVLRAKEGRFIQKPMLIGNNNNEAGLFSTITALSGQPANSTLDLLRNLEYTCLAATATARRLSKGIPIWRYRWMGEFPNQRISPTAGAFHGSEIPHVFGLSEGISKTKNATENQILVSAVMNKAWAGFAKDPARGLEGVGWPRYLPDGQTLVLLAENNGPGITFTEGKKYDGQCSLLKDYTPPTV